MVVTSLDILSYHLAALMVVVAALEKEKMREEVSASHLGLALTVDRSVG